VLTSEPMFDERLDDVYRNQEQLDLAPQVRHSQVGLLWRELYQHFGADIAYGIACDAVSPVLAVHTLVHHSDDVGDEPCWNEVQVVHSGILRYTLESRKHLCHSFGWASGRAEGIKLMACSHCWALGGTGCLPFPSRANDTSNFSSCSKAG
jgi:hypothetical protein